ncbi:hypothetical protein TUBRATIS_22090 [Tubulinosema ratisbonensis]|uniref:Uncharacterized protein n=1 Tax=Tubulinosema ratisbonensis TaxID=291195 RepID=A0A437AJP9_9MICR|nr:hypothetical protein TUBRATIS_22090 [Tubulinosema ratisbonensis]
MSLLKIFKSLSNFTLKDVEYLLEGTKISQSKLSQLIFYEDLFLPHRNTVKEIYGYFSLQKEVKEDYLRRFKIEDLTSLIAYWFNQNIFTLFPSENFTFIRLALQNKTFFTKIQFFLYFYIFFYHILETLSLNQVILFYKFFLVSLLLKNGLRKVLMDLLEMRLVL